MAAAVLGQSFLVHIGHTLPANQDVPRIGTVNTAQNIKQGRFAGPGRAKQHTELAFFYGQINAFQHLDTVIPLAEGLFDLVELQEHGLPLFSQKQLVYHN